MHLFLFISLTDEEHKLGKGRLSEIVERSLPSHIYILVSENSTSLQCFNNITLSIIRNIFAAEIAVFRRISEFSVEIFLKERKHYYISLFLYQTTLRD